MVLQTMKTHSNPVLQLYLLKYIHLFLGNIVVSGQ